MKFLILLAALFTLCSGRSFNIEQLSKLLRFQVEPKLLNETSRIVGGIVAKPNEFPFQISLQRRNGLGWSHSCGGSVYNQRYIIDAAHCVDGTSSSNLRVVAGEHSLTQVSGFEQTISVSSYLMHPNYNNQNSDNDIALLRLSSPLNFSNGKVGPINLPLQDESINAGTACTVSGWGTTSSNGAISDVLLKVAVPVVSNTECNRLYGGNSITSSMLCAGLLAGGADSCQGDSGGPLFTSNPNTLVGVVSWGRGCAVAGYPGVYTRVAKFVSWIRNNAV